MGESGGEGVAGANGVGNFNGNAGMLVPFVACDEQAAAAAAGDGYQLEGGELSEQALGAESERPEEMAGGIWSGGIWPISAWESKKPHDEGDLGVVHLHDRGQFERLLNDLAGVEGSAQVYVKDTNAL